MKLVTLINAASAITKIAQSDDLSASYVWDILDFVDNANQESKKFDTMRLKVAEEATEDKDGEPMINVAKYNTGLEELFNKEIELDCSVIDLEEIKKVEGLTVAEALAMKELLQE